jgi:hypothetical protein
LTASLRPFALLPAGDDSRDSELEGAYWERLRAFVEGRATLRETSAWRDAHLGAITASASWITGELDGLFAFHLCEHHLSRRSADEVRAALGEDLLAVVTPPGVPS